MLAISRRDILPGETLTAVSQVASGAEGEPIYPAHLPENGCSPLPFWIESLIMGVERGIAYLMIRWQRRTPEID